MRRHNADHYQYLQSDRACRACGFGWRGVCGLDRCTKAGEANGTDIFFAQSDIGPWTNTPFINAAGNQSNPTMWIASQADVAWVDGNDLNVGTLGSETQESILDPCEPDALPKLPTLVATESDVNDRVFVAWVDSRDVVGTNGDTDIYFAAGNPLFGTNILVNDDTGVHRQTKPAIGVDADGAPFIVWVDNRLGNDDIFFAGSTVISPLETVVVPGEGETIVQAVEDEDLQVQIPDGALPDGIDANDITIAEVTNPPQPPANTVSLAFDFGPSGVVFDEPVTLRIPLPDDAPVFPTYIVYRYDAGTGTWTQEGIVNPAKRFDEPDGSFLEVQVNHFTMFVSSGAAVGGDGGGGGGCALSPWNNAGPVEFLLPFAALVLALLAYSIVGGLRRRSEGTRE